MRIAVTGGLGRVGRVVVDAAQRDGHSVLVLDDVEDDGRVEIQSDFLQINVRDFDRLKAALEGVDAVVHLAAIPGPWGLAEQEVHNNNVVASYNVLQAAATSGIRRVVMASSVNAIGATFSRAPTFDYFPIDVAHRSRNEDAYSLSKWIGESQADSVVRRYPDLSIASLRIHSFVTDRDDALAGIKKLGEDWGTRGLWGYTTHHMLSTACLQAYNAPFTGHHVLWVVAPITSSHTPTRELAARDYPNVPLRAPLEGHTGFFDCTDTERLLGWSSSDQIA